MAEVTFGQLVGVYKNAIFTDIDDPASVTVADASVLETLRLIDSDPEARWLSQIATIDELSHTNVRDVVRVMIRSPVQHLGVLAPTFDDLLLFPRARVREPTAFYVVDGGVTSDMEEPQDVLRAYRAVISFVGLLAEAAAFLDDVQQELLFVGETRTLLPVTYDRKDLVETVAADASALVDLFADDLHRDQKLAILADTVIAACASTPEDARFGALLRMLATISRDVAAGYRAFASEFSYAKIRRDVETAQFEYVGKIHKTFTDIQNQLLGIPIATFLVVSQMKPANTCGADLAMDVAVVAGAWVYAILVILAVINQLMTLHAINNEITHQRTKIAQDHPAVIGEFLPVFNSLWWRMQVHRTGLVIVGAIAIAGAVAASMAENRLVTPSARTCLFGSSAPEDIDLSKGVWARSVTPAAAGQTSRVAMEGRMKQSVNRSKPFLREVQPVNAQPTLAGVPSSPEGCFAAQ